MAGRVIIAAALFERAASRGSRLNPIGIGTMESTLSVASIVLASVGILATGIGYVLRQYNEDRRVARNVLFNLLGIWEVCVALAEPPGQFADHAIEEYKNAAGELFGKDAAEQLDSNDPEFRAIFKPLLIQLILSNRPTLTDDLRDNYLSSLTKLSERHPVLAYKLTGRERIEELLCAVDAYEIQATQALERALEKTEVGEVVETAQRIARKSVMNQLIEGVERDLRRVAWVAGLANWLRCVHISRKSRRHVLHYEAMRAELRDEFTVVLRQLAMEYSKRRSSAEPTPAPVTNR